METELGVRSGLRRGQRDQRRSGLGAVGANRAELAAIRRASQLVADPPDATVERAADGKLVAHAAPPLIPSTTLSSLLRIPSITTRIYSTRADMTNRYLI